MLYRVYGSETVLEVVPKVESWGPVQNYINFILKRLSCLQGFQIQIQILLPDILTKKVLIEPLSDIKGYPCLHFKVSEFHSEAAIEVCFYVWVIELRSISRIHICKHLNIFIYRPSHLEVARRHSQGVCWTLLLVLVHWWFSYILMFYVLMDCLWIINSLNFAWK